MAEKKTGVLYGVGVGPGDPELMTLKACRIINENKYIAYPGKTKEETLCYKIAEQVIKEPEKKIYISCCVQMTKDREILDKNYDLAAAGIIEILEKGENVVFLTLGDPTVYATYIYVHDRVKKAGCHAEIVSGVPSFCAAAARLDISLAQRGKMLHVIPSSYDIEEALSLAGTKILMKSASRLKEHSC